LLLSEIAVPGAVIMEVKIVEGDPPGAEDGSHCQRMEPEHNSMVASTASGRLGRHQEKSRI
jgi:hypothetical protein